MSNEIKFKFKAGRFPMPMRAKVVGDSGPEMLRGKVVDFDVSDVPDWTRMPSCISIVRNVPPPDAPLLPIPDGLTRCSACGEFIGVMALKDIPGLRRSDRSTNPDTPMRIQCICDGVVCPCCETNRFHRPGTDVWEERCGFQHVPEWRGLFPCDECSAKREAQAAADRRMGIEQRRKSNEPNPS